MNDAGSDDLPTAPGFLTWLQHLDHQIQLASHSFGRSIPHGAAPDSIAKVLTQLGKPFSYLWLAAGLAFVDPPAAFAVFCLVLASEILNWVLKRRIRRPRPSPKSSTPVETIEGKFAFPSAHAQLSAAVWGWLAASAGSEAAWLPALAVIAAVGWSRLYLRHHYPTDIIAGWTLGAATAAAGLAIF
ncbi:phosphatase PAP2 family protein [Hoeflea sp. WL0058]|uniref:Phosphatase PAP2 family protein n=1 Tax=Flavimaribacter sediminis TaxID=2865987 RepID=A0AAE3D1C0_9HYPH|nr:phosphatase PAP2 family protein [Flavimaribacter sediminis]MBW8637762.1 phosphatase PAP2 family protein [Flavimaribacter sediminis]